MPWNNYEATKLKREVLDRWAQMVKLHVQEELRMYDEAIQTARQFSCFCHWIKSNVSNPRVLFNTRLGLLNSKRWIWWIYSGLQTDRRTETALVKVIRIYLDANKPSVLVLLDQWGVTLDYFLTNFWTSLERLSSIPTNLQNKLWGFRATSF